MKEKLLMTPKSIYKDPSSGKEYKTRGLLDTLFYGLLIIGNIYYAVVISATFNAVIVSVIAVIVGAIVIKLAVPLREINKNKTSR